MTVIPPITGHNVGQSVGGGFLDSIKNAIAGAGGGGEGAAGAGAAGPAGAGTAGAAKAAGGGTKGDGSVGLMDGVLLKAGLGGAAGAVAGWVMPFGGPIIGGIVGALGGVVMGVFGNMKKMNDIKQQNQAILDQMGVGTQDPAVQQILQSGQVQQLVPMAQQEMAGYAQQGVAPQKTGQYPTTDTSVPGQYYAGQVGGGMPGQQGAGQTPFPAQVGLNTHQTPTAQLDPSATPGQSPVPTQAPIGVNTPAVDSSIYTGQVPSGFPGSVDRSGAAQYATQVAPPVPTAISQDPSVAQNVGAASVMNVSQASATLGAPQQTTEQVPYGIGGGDILQSAHLNLQIARLDEQIAALKRQIAELPSAAPGTQTAPTTQAA